MDRIEVAVRQVTGEIYAANFSAQCPGNRFDADGFRHGLTSRTRDSR